MTFLSILFALLIEQLKPLRADNPVYAWIKQFAGKIEASFNAGQARQGWQVTALERDLTQAAKARGRCHEVIVADLDQAAPRLQGLFDAIVYGDVLEHLTEPLPVVVATVL